MVVRMMVVVITLREASMCCALCIDGLFITAAYLAVLYRSLCMQVLLCTKARQLNLLWCVV